jgi:hypothetical protein
MSDAAGGTCRLGHKGSDDRVPCRRRGRKRSIGLALASESASAVWGLGLVWAALALGLVSPV